MTRIFLSFLLCVMVIRGDSNTIFDKRRLEDFYRFFLIEQKNIDATVHLSGSDSLIPNPPPSLNPLTPPSPLPTPSKANCFPLVIVNNTGLPDSEVYFTVFGNRALSCGEQGESVVLVYEGSNLPVYQTTNHFPKDTYIAGYSYQLSTIPEVTDVIPGESHRVLYFPAMNNSEMLFSLGGALQLYSNGSSHPTVPQYTNTQDPNYFLVYQDLECTFYPDCNGTIPQFTMDVTCVDSYGFSVGLQAFQTPGVQNGPNTGIFQSRATVLSELQASFNSAFGSSVDNWNKLILRNGSKILRVVSPGYSSSNSSVPQPSHFDTNYWNNQTAYGYSWSNNVWINPNEYYTQGNSFEITVSSGNVYQGMVGFIPPYSLGSFFHHSGGYGFIFTLQGNGTRIEPGTTFYIPWVDSPATPNITIPAPYPGFNTSTALLETATVFPGMAVSSSNKSGIRPIQASSATNTTIDATVITQIFGGAIVAGLIPGKLSSLAFTPGPTPSDVDLYYQSNTNLPAPGTTTGPWFDLYSKGILGNYKVTGNAAYAYAYDDYLYKNPDVLKVIAQVPVRTVDNEGNSLSYCVITLGLYSDH